MIVLLDEMLGAGMKLVLDMHASSAGSSPVVSDSEARERKTLKSFK